MSKKTFFGYKEEDVKQHLRSLEKDYTEKVAAKRKKQREILDKNNKIRNQIDLITKETDKITRINSNYSNSIGVFIKEINEAENGLNLIRQEEEAKRKNHYSKLEHKVKELKSCCRVLGSSMEELTLIIKKNKINSEADL